MWLRPTPIATATTREVDLPAKALKVLEMLRANAPHLHGLSEEGWGWWTVDRHGPLRGMTHFGYREHVKALILIGVVRRSWILRQGVLKQSDDENFIEVKKKIDQV
ncbi:MAG: hypothetical protein PGN34_01200 [Methylobacterium frigidaeris]